MVDLTNAGGAGYSESRYDFQFTLRDGPQGNQSGKGWQLAVAGQTEQEARSEIGKETKPHRQTSHSSLWNHKRQYIISHLILPETYNYNWMFEISAVACFGPALWDEHLCCQTQQQLQVFSPLKKSFVVRVA